MKRTLSIVFLALLSLAAFSQEKAPIAVIQEDQETFVMSSLENATYTVHRRVLVNEERGLEAGVFSEVTDRNRSLSSFSATVTHAGKKIVKAKLSDVYQSSASSSLVDDILEHTYVPSAPFPFVVEYDYTMTFRKGVPFIPMFMPVDCFDVPLEHASYSVTIPQGEKLRVKASAEPASKDGNRYVWEFSNVAAVKHEPMMPDVLELVPYVRACTERFYYGTNGSQESWEDIGAWNAFLFPSDEIPQTLKDKMAELTRDCDDVPSKVRAVYGYLREHTRYVSIQLGLGGYAPFSPATVAKNGYGDCKALSFFMQTLLKSIGIESDYVGLNTDVAELDFPSLGRLNHAMLCVPMEKDSLWVECTNPSIPLGFRHDGIAGHDVVLIKGVGSRKVHVPSYPDSLKCLYEHVDVMLEGNGAARMDAGLLMKLDRAESYAEVRNWDKKTQIGKLTGGFRGSLEDFWLGSVTDNFDRWKGETDYVPEIYIRYGVSSRSYGRVNGDRMFVPVPVYAASLDVKRGERLYDMVVSGSSSRVEKITIHIPEGFVVESMPALPSMSTDFFDLECSAVQNGNLVEVIIKTSVKKGRFPKETYSEFRNLAKSFNKVYDANLVIVKK